MTSSPEATTGQFATINQPHPFEFFRPFFQTMTFSDPGETRLVRLINNFYKRWAYFIAAHPVAIIVICTIITLIGTAKIITTPYVHAIPWESMKCLGMRMTSKAGHPMEPGRETS